MEIRCRYPARRLSRSALEPVERGQLGGAGQQRLSLDGETHVVVGVRATHRRSIRVLLEPCGRDLAYRDEHREERHPMLVELAQEAAVDQFEERFEQVDGPRRIRRDRLDGIEAEIAREHAEAHEQGSRVGSQQVDAPLDCRLDRPLPFRHVPGGGHQQRKHPIESPACRRGERADAGGRELDRQGHALERLADARDIRGVVLGDVESRVGGPGAIAEQPDRRRVEDVGRRRLRRVRGQAKGFDVENVLPRTRSRDATRHQEGRVGQFGEQRRDQRGGTITCSKLSSTIRSRRPARAMASSRSADGRRRRARREPVRSPAALRRRHAGARARRTSPGRTDRRAMRDLEGEAALADSAGTHERDEPARILAQPREQRRDIVSRPTIR